MLKLNPSALPERERGKREILPLKAYKLDSQDRERKKEALFPFYRWGTKAQT